MKEIEELIKNDNGCITDVRTVVVYRKNMLRRCNGISFVDADLFCFKYNEEKTPFRFSCVQDIIMFVDDDGQTKLLKNRYGRPGEVK